MDPKTLAFVALAIAVIAGTGCVTNTPGTPTTPAAGSFPTTPIVTTTNQGAPGECLNDTDCIPAECCHPLSCIPGPREKPCTLMCTAVCEGPLDCGAGRCGCVNERCSIIPASSPAR